MPLATFMPLEAVMKLAWALCVLGMAASVWFLHRSLFERTQPTLLLAAIALLNLPLAAGLINFALALPVALLALGLWFRMGDRATMPSLVMVNLLAGLVLVLHVAAFAALALTLAVLLGVRAPWRAKAVLRRAGMLACAFLLPASLLLAVFLTRAAPASAAGFGAIAYLPLRKIQLVAAPFFTGNLVADLIGTVVLWGGAIVALRLGGGHGHPRFRAALLVWLVVLLALPSEIGSATVIDLRLAVFPVMLLIAAMAAPRRRGWSSIIAVAAAAAVLGRTASVLPEWFAHDAHVASFRAIEDAVSPGARVLVAAAPDAAGGDCRAAAHWPPYDEHIPTLLAIDRGAFVSTLFAAPGLQPIEPTAAVASIATQNAGIIPWSVLAYGDSAAGQSEMVHARPGSVWRIYPRDWRKNYDYLALRRSGCVTEIEPQDGLERVGDSLTYRLYRIVHPATP